MHSAILMGDSIKDELVESVWPDIKLGKRDVDNIRLGTFYSAGNLAAEIQDKVDHMICNEICRNFQPKCLIMGDFNLNELCRTAYIGYMHVHEVLKSLKSLREHISR